MNRHVALRPARFLLRFVLGVRRGQTTLAAGSSVTITTGYGLLLIRDLSNGNTYCYLCYNGSLKEIINGGLNVNISVAKVSNTEASITRTSGSGWIGWRFVEV